MELISKYKIKESNTASSLTVVKEKFILASVNTLDLVVPNIGS